MKNTLSYFIDPSVSNSEIRYVFDFVFKTIGIRSIPLNSASSLDMPVDIYYGNENSCAPIIIRHNTNDVAINIGNIKITKDKSNIIETDIINSIRFFILDLGNQALNSLCNDEHNRLIFEESYQYLRNIQSYPVVNVLVDFTESIIKQTFPDISTFPRWPNGKKAVIVLSHDVDFPQKYADLRNFFKVNDDKNSEFSLRKYFSYLNLYRKYIQDRNKNEFWLFEKVMNEEVKYGFRSTYFFASRNRYHKGSSLFDVNYDVAEKEFEEVFLLIKDYKCEIALHASYNAFNSSDYFIEEKQKLEAIAKTEVVGLRHHYWHLGKNITATLEMHNQAGFKYDSSIAFNYDIGFRYNIALPFYPYDKRKEQAIQCMQLPPFCMDMGLFNKKYVTVDYALYKISRYIDEIIQLNGIGVINWHDYTSFPTSQDRYVGRAYIEILNVLSINYKNTWVTTCKEVYEWIDARNKKISEIE